jgi:hypothetical protein
MRTIPGSSVQMQRELAAGVAHGNDERYCHTGEHKPGIIDFEDLQSKPYTIPSMLGNRYLKRKMTRY